MARDMYIEDTKRNTTEATMDYLHYAVTADNIFHCFDTIEDCSAWAENQSFGSITACYCVPVGSEYLMPDWDNRKLVVHHIDEG